MAVYDSTITFNLDFTTKPLLSEHKALKACQMLLVAFFNNNAMSLFTDLPISAATGDSYAVIQYSNQMELRHHKALKCKRYRSDLGILLKRNASQIVSFDKCLLVRIRPP